MRCDMIVNVFPHRALILLPDGGSSPQGVDAVNSQSQAEVWLRLPALRPQLLHHGSHHVTAALHARYSLQRNETPLDAWSDLFESNQMATPQIQLFY